MAPRLGELLVEKGLCARPVIDRALQAQAVFGGRLGTNLLEVGALSEERLAYALGDRHATPALFGDLRPELAALDLITPNDADRWEVVPLRAAPRKLVLLTVDPSNVAVLDEVAFATGRTIDPFVVPEARLWRLLARLYGVFREERGIDQHQRSGGIPAAPMPSGPDLIDEAEFHALYGRVGLTTPPPFQSPLSPPHPESLAESYPELIPEPSAEPSAEPSPEPSAELSPVAGPSPFWINEPSPLDFGEAVRFLEGVEERGAIARIVLRYARSRFMRAVLLIVRNEAVHGWEALGPGVIIDRVHRLKLPLSAEGVVASVVATQSHYLGPLARTEANMRLLKAMGGGVPKTAFAIPILALGRVVNVIYIDNGRGQLVDPDDLGELLILAARIAQGYDTLASRAV